VNETVSQKENLDDRGKKNWGGGEAKTENRGVEKKGFTKKRQTGVQGAD